jgi:iron complex outermembrane recepter protein
MLPGFCPQTQAGNINGKVFDAQHEPLPYQSILLHLAADSALFKVELSGEKGEFLFENIHPGQYYLEIKAMGWQKYSSPLLPINHPEDKVDLGEIVLKTSSTKLNEVMVVEQKPFIEREIDKTVVNIENSIVQSGSSVLEVMEKLPGIMVDQNGNISLRGKQGVMIWIDGKPGVLAGQDLANVLRGMPSAGIQKIEIITNPSARFDAAGNAGIINIIMKKNKREGFNGNISLGYGQGRYAKYNTGLSLNYKEKWFNLFFNYGYAKRMGFNNLDIDRKFYANQQINTRFLTENYIWYPTENHSPRLGVDFYLNKKTSLSVLATGLLSMMDPTTRDNTKIYSGSETLSREYDFENYSSDRWKNYAFNTELKHDLDTNGQQIIVNLDFGQYSNKTLQDLRTTYYHPNGSFDLDEKAGSTQISNLYLYAAKADYVKPLLPSLKFEAGLKSSYVQSDNDFRFFDYKKSDAFIDTARSSHFLYSENINAGYLNFSKEYSKLSLQLGLRAEQTIARGKQYYNDQSFTRNYWQVFPTAYVDYKIKEKHGLNLSLGKRIDRPAYEQMNPYRNLINATTFSEGNAYLLPQLSYNAELTYTFHQSLFIACSYGLTTQNITEVLIQNFEEQTTIQTTANLDRMNYYSANINYTKKINSWWTTNTGLLSYLAIYSGNINSNQIDQGLPTFYFNTGNSFFLKEGLSMELNFQYNYKNLYGITTINTTSNLTAGIKKSILKNRGSVTLNVTDIFWNAYPSGTTEFDNVVEDWVAKRDSRVVNVNFTYKFGEGNPIRMRRNTGADDEKSRIQKS